MQIKVRLKFPPTSPFVFKVLHFSSQSNITDALEYIEEKCNTRAGWGLYLPFSSLKSPPHSGGKGYWLENTRMICSYPMSLDECEYVLVKKKPGRSYKEILTFTDLPTYKQGKIMTLDKDNTWGSKFLRLHETDFSLADHGQDFCLNKVSLKSDNLISIERISSRKYAFQILTRNNGNFCFRTISQKDTDLWIKSLEMQALFLGYQPKEKIQPLHFFSGSFHFSGNSHQCQTRKRSSSFIESKTPSSPLRVMTRRNSISYYKDEELHSIPTPRPSPPKYVIRRRSSSISQIIPPQLKFKKLNDKEMNIIDDTGNDLSFQKVMNDPITPRDNNNDNNNNDFEKKETSKTSHQDDFEKDPVVPNTINNGILKTESVDKENKNENLLHQKVMLSRTKSPSSSNYAFVLKTKYEEMGKKLYNQEKQLEEANENLERYKHLIQSEEREIKDIENKYLKYKKKCHRMNTKNEIFKNKLRNSFDICTQYREKLHLSLKYQEQAHLMFQKFDTHFSKETPLSTLQHTLDTIKSQMKKYPIVKHVPANPNSPLPPSPLPLPPVQLDPHYILDQLELFNYYSTVTCKISDFNNQNQTPEQKKTIETETKNCYQKEKEKMTSFEVDIPNNSFLTSIETELKRLQSALLSLLEMIE